MGASPTEGIVFITIPGSDKAAFVNTLHERTGGGVVLVVIQKPKSKNLLSSIARLYRVVGIGGLLRELWYSMRLRLSAKRRKMLAYFRRNTASVDLHPLEGTRRDSRSFG